MRGGEARRKTTRTVLFTKSTSFRTTQAAALTATSYAKFLDNTLFGCLAGAR